MFKPHYQVNTKLKHLSLATKSSMKKAQKLMFNRFNQHSNNDFTSSLPHLCIHTCTNLCTFTNVHQQNHKNLLKTHALAL